MKKEHAGWTRKNMGERAIQLKTPLGTIACPHCGAVGCGAISPICGMCDKPYWPEFYKNPDLGLPAPDPIMDRAIDKHFAKRKSVTKKLMCKHIFLSDGGPCSKCGKTYIELVEE